MHRSADWQPHEDQALLELYCNRKITRWTELSRVIKEEFGVRHCNPKKCRERFKNHLNPDIRKEEWEQMEDRKLIELQGRLGNRWAAIARELPGRTDNSVKNRFYAKMRKAIRNANAIGKEHLDRRFKDITIAFIFKLSKLIDSQHKQDETAQTGLIQTAQGLQRRLMTLEDVQTTDLPTLVQTVASIASAVQEVNNSFKRKTSKNRQLAINRQERLLARAQSDTLQKQQLSQVKQEREKEEMKAEEEQVKIEEKQVEIKEEEVIAEIKPEGKVKEEASPESLIEVQPILVEEPWQIEPVVDIWEEVWMLNDPSLI